MCAWAALRFSRLFFAIAAATAHSASKSRSSRISRGRAYLVNFKYRWRAQLVARHKSGQSYLPLSVPTSERVNQRALAGKAAFRSAMRHAFSACENFSRLSATCAYYSHAHARTCGWVTRQRCANEQDDDASSLAHIVFIVAACSALEPSVFVYSRITCETSRHHAVKTSSRSFKRHLHWSYCNVQEDWPITASECEHDNLLVDWPVSCDMPRYVAM